MWALIGSFPFRSISGFISTLYKVLNVNNDSLIVMCVVPEGLLADYLTKGGLAAKGDYVED